MLEENTKPPRAIAGPANLCTANLGFMDNTIVVFFAELEDRDTVLACVRFENVGKVGSFSLGWDTETIRTIARQASLGVEARQRHPHAVVFLDSSLNGAFQPCLVFFELGSIELVEDLQGHISQEWGLRSAQIVAPASVKDLSVEKNAEKGSEPPRRLRVIDQSRLHHSIEEELCNNRPCRNA